MTEPGVTVPVLDADIDGRQGGKTTRMLQWLREAPEGEHRVLVCHTEEDAMRVYRDNRDEFESWQFVGPNDLRDPGAWSGVLMGRGGRIVLGLDNLDLLLRQWVRWPVGRFSATATLDAARSLGQREPEPGLPGEPVETPRWAIPHQPIFFRRRFENDSGNANGGFFEEDICGFCHIAKDRHEALAGQREPVGEALRRLDAIARVDTRNEWGDAELDAALDDSYWALNPDKPYSVADKANRDRIEARLAALRAAANPEREEPVDG